jgi:RNA polymerase sigma-70 factor (ECF subfamily)
MKNDYAKYSDDELVKLMKSGKPVSDYAFTEIYSRYSSKVHVYCRGMLHDSDQAKDVFQDTFVRFYNNVKENNINVNVPGYIMTIARNLCLNSIRNKKYPACLTENVYITDERSNMENKDLFRLMMASLDIIDEKLKEAFVLREIDGLSFNELAETCGITVTNAKRRVYRAREKLLEIMEPYLNEKI